MLSVILLPTLECNAACDYCFEHKAKVRLGLEQLPVLADRLLGHMASRRLGEATLYWQGGEVMLLGPRWFEQAHAVLGEAAARAGCTFHHSLQTNLVGWHAGWNDVVRGMFRGSLGTSMDFPNVHRRLRNGSAEGYTEVWLRAMDQVREAGFSVGVIAVLHSSSLEAGPQAFYRFFTGTAGVTDFQVNMPFPGGPNEGRGTLEPAAVSGFLLGLLREWSEQGLDAGVRLGPFAELLDHFAGRPTRLPCLWQRNCADEFLAVDPLGRTAVCDCWVASYPEHGFGNLFESASLGEMLGGSAGRSRFLERPRRLMEAGGCAACRWLSLCHGGCPIRTFTATGTLEAKDPYCGVYQDLFRETRRLAAEVTRRRLAARRAP